MSVKIEQVRKSLPVEKYYISMGTALFVSRGWQFEPHVPHQAEQCKEVGGPGFDSIVYMLERGCRRFVELGPVKVLSRLIEDIQENRTAVTTNQFEPRPKSSSGKELALKMITPEKLGCADFKQDYGLKYAYIAGSMYHGISSIDLVAKMAFAGFLGFFGTGGLSLDKIEETIQTIKQRLDNGQPYGMNLLHNPSNPKKEEKTVDLFLRFGVNIIEASAFLRATQALVRYRVAGLQAEAGRIVCRHRVIAKLSRPEIAKIFMSPAPRDIVEQLLEKGAITAEQAQLAERVPLADDICSEADSGGHTDGAVAYALLPTILRMRDQAMKKHGYARSIKVGAAGGIGTPEAAAAALLLGADFILTGSINQCTVEAGTSDQVKSFLQQMNIQDTEYVPAGDMFEMGAKVQVFKKGLFFPARANRLYQLYQQFDSIDDMDEQIRHQLEQKYFNRTFDEIFADAVKFYSPEEIERANAFPKYKLSLILRWYFGHCTRLAINGDELDKINYQIHCGPALGAFNQWVRGTAIENWQNRHVDDIATKIMMDSAELLNRRMLALSA